jgi:hypothetical protein
MYSYEGNIKCKIYWRMTVTLLRYEIKLKTFVSYWLKENRNAEYIMFCSYAVTPVTSTQWCKSVWRLAISKPAEYNDTFPLYCDVQFKEWADPPPKESYQMLDVP